MMPSQQVIVNISVHSTTASPINVFQKHDMTVNVDFLLVTFYQMTINNFQYWATIRRKLTVSSTMDGLPTRKVVGLLVFCTLNQISSLHNSHVSHFVMCFNNTSRSSKSLFCYKKISVFRQQLLLTLCVPGKALPAAAPPLSR